MKTLPFLGLELEFDDEDYADITALLKTHPRIEEWLRTREGMYAVADADETYFDYVGCLHVLARTSKLNEKTREEFFSRCKCVRWDKSSVKIHESMHAVLMYQFDTEQYLKTMNEYGGTSYSTIGELMNALSTGG